VSDEKSYVENSFSGERLEMGKKKGDGKTRTGVLSKTVFRDIMSWGTESLFATISKLVVGSEE
jgi:hypothetical protein